MIAVQFKLAHPKARKPTRATEGAAGFDLYACEPVLVQPGRTASVRTGVCLAMPERVEVTRPGPDTLANLLSSFAGGPRFDVGYFGVEAQVRGRSSLAFKHGVLGHVGTIDSDYRGEIGVLLLNTSGRTYAVRVGDRVAQLVFAPVLLPELVEVEELPETARGSGGFGSTGA